MRRGRYNLAKLIEKHGRNGNATKWLSDLRGDCPKRDIPQLHERCNPFCPDVPRVILTKCDGAGVKARLDSALSANTPQLLHAVHTSA